MKNLFLSVMIILLGGGLLSAQTVTVSNLLVTEGTPSTVTFDVSWERPSPGTVWMDSAWVFVDYNKNGVMTRLELLLGSGATLTDNSAPGEGALEEVPGNTSGAWVKGYAWTDGSFSATVQLLTATANLSGACAYASGYPPVGDWLSDSKLGFTGTPMYEVTLTHTNGSTITVSSGGSFFLPCSYTVSSFTDRTGAPGIFNCIRPATYTLSGVDVCKGEEVTLTLDGSESEWQYQLHNGTAFVGSAVPGGGALIFKDTPVSAGEYGYTVQTVNGAGVRCDMPVTAVLGITVNLTPDALSLMASTTTVCAGQPVTLMAKADYGAKYSLTGNGTDWKSSNAFIETPSVATSYTLYVQTAAGCTATKANAATVTVISLPDAPTSPSSNLRCGSGTVTFSASVPAGHTIDWYTTSNGATLVNGGSGVTSFSPSIYSTTTYHAQARNTTTGCVSATRLAVTGTLNDTPHITYATNEGDYDKTVQRGAAMTPVSYTAQNATGIFLYSGSFPDGITGSVDSYDNLVFVIKGTPTSSVSAGVYYYQVGATHTACPSVVSTWGGWIEVITTPPAAKTANTYPFGSQIWSDLVDAQPTNCTRVSFSLTSTDYPSPEYTVVNGEYYYNAPCVGAAQSVLCPYPWRVPTKSDFETLAGNASVSALSSAWGGGGVFFSGSNHVSDTIYEWLWSSEANYGIWWWYLTTGSMSVDVAFTAQENGMQVRCVKDS